MSVQPKGDALGLLETEGQAAAIAALDAAAKTGRIGDVRYEYVIGPEGFVTIKFRGKLADVQEAVEAGREAAERVTRAYSARVIAKPHPGTETVVASPDSFSRENRPPRKIPKELYPPQMGRKR